MKRENTRKIMVGNVQIGGQNKVVIQSMCNTKTKDVTSTVKQILELEKAGCEIIRVTQYAITALIMKSLSVNVLCCFITSPS